MHNIIKMLATAASITLFLSATSCSDDSKSALSTFGNYPVTESTSWDDGSEQWHELLEKSHEHLDSAVSFFREKQRSPEQADALSVQLAQLHAEIAALPVNRCLNASRVTLFRAISYTHQRVPMYRDSTSIAKTVADFDREAILRLMDEAGSDFNTCLTFSRYKRLTFPVVIGHLSQDDVVSWPIDNSSGSTTGVDQLEALFKQIARDINEAKTLARGKASFTADIAGQQKLKLDKSRVDVTSLPLSTCLNHARPYLLGIIDAAKIGIDASVKQGGAGDPQLEITPDTGFPELRNRALLRAEYCERIAGKGVNI